MLFCDVCQTFHYFTGFVVPTPNYDNLVSWHHHSCMGNPLLAEQGIDITGGKIILYDLNIAYSVHSSCPLRQAMQDFLVNFLVSTQALVSCPPHATNCRPLPTTEMEWPDLPWDEKNGCSTIRGGLQI